MADLARTKTSSSCELVRTRCQWTEAAGKVCVGPNVSSAGDILCRKGFCMRYALDKMWQREHPGTDLDLP